VATIFEREEERQANMDWKVPPHNAPPEHVQQWAESFIEQGARWLENTRTLQSLQADIRLLNGDVSMPVKSNQLLPDIQEFVETFSDVRKICSYSTKLEAIKASAEVMNGFQQHVFDSSSFRDATKTALQWSTLGRGYIWPKFSIDRYGYGKASVRFEALGPLDVVFDQLPASNNLDEAYAVGIIRPVPLVEAHARFDRFAERILPVEHYDWKKYGTLGTVRRMDFYSRWRFQEEPSDWARHYTELHYIWVRTIELNNGPKFQTFGKDGAPWQYTVPPMKSLIVTRNPFNKAPQSREAKHQDCLLYPQLRLIITCPTVTVPLYDGTAFDWHGEHPPVPYDLTKVAWSPLAPSLVSQVSSLERARRRLISTSTEVTEVSMNPPLGFDLNAGVPQKQLNNMNLLRSQGVRIGTAGKPSEKFANMLDKGMVEGAKQSLEQIKMIDAVIAKGLGLTDIARMLTEAKQALSEGNFDKLMNGMGPFGSAVVANECSAHKKIGNMLKYMAPEYYTEKQMMSYAGEDKSTIETFTFDPAKFDPNSPDSPYVTEGMTTRERCMWLVDQLEASASPAEILGAMHQQEQMKWMFFLEHNMPVSKATCMTKLDVANYGETPGDTEREKYEYEQERDTLRQIKLREMVMEEMPQQPAAPPPGGGGPGQGKGGGRPNANTAPPKLEQKGGKGGQPRTVLSTSK
jgi:hypothetical protein